MRLVWNLLPHHNTHIACLLVYYYYKMLDFIPFISRDLLTRSRTNTTTSLHLFFFSRLFMFLSGYIRQQLLRAPATQCNILYRDLCCDVHFTRACRPLGWPLEALTKLVNEMCCQHNVCECVNVFFLSLDTVPH